MRPQHSIVKKLICLIKTIHVLTTAYLFKCFHMVGSMSDIAAIQSPADSEFSWRSHYPLDQLCLWGRCKLLQH